MRASVVHLSVLFLFLVLATPLLAADDPPQPPPFQPEEIEALVAPIALYPDALLAQVLMASTYPLEVVHAARWVKQNPKLKGDAAVKAVENQPWDVSVKSLVAFPQILGPMNDKLDWTQRLGDAFLAQQQDVFAAVQRLRKQARDAGNLQSNAQQKVSAQPVSAGATDTVVRIESADPAVVYVPAYNPTLVYGAWSSPAYPPAYWAPPPAYYPGTALMSGLAFGVGVAATAAIFSDCDWGGGDVDIDYNKVTNIDRNVDRGKVQGQSGRWQHDPGHRQGVAYRDNATRQKMAGQVPGADQRSQYRGRETEAGASRERRADGAAATNRTAGGTRAAAADRPAGPGPGSSARRSNVDGARKSSSSPVGGQRDSAFSGVGAGGAAAQRSHDRGRASFQGSAAGRSSAGGVRGGGSRGGGGRR